MTYDMNYPKLENCPFCGDDEISTYHYLVGDIPALNKRFGIYCNGCDRHIQSDWKTENEAVEGWNRRK